MTDDLVRRQLPVSTRPDATDDAHLDVLLRGFADEAEPLITMSADPEGVRRRARIRRNRKRVGASTALVSGALLAASLTWSLLPPTAERSGAPTVNASDRPDPVAAASLLPPQEPDGSLTADALLAPSSLPWSSTYHWRTLRSGHSPDTPLPETGRGPCRVEWFEDLPTTDVIARTYAGQGEATAQHRITAFPNVARAAGATSELTSRLRECGWHETRTAETVPSHGGTSPGEPTDLHEYVLTSGPGDSVRVTLVQSDNRVAVLTVSTAVSYDHAHPDSRTDACLDKSLRRGSTAPSENPQPENTPERC